MTVVHLLVLIHGMWGNPNHLNEMARTIKEVHKLQAPDVENQKVDLHVLQAHSNSEEFTYDGIDWGAERVAEELLQEIEKLKEEGRPVTRISICGYSLGGLIARYLVGILYQRNFFETAGITPVGFYAFASPHCGLPRYPTFPSKIMFSLGPKLLARTGEQFFLKDKWGPEGRPLITVMADPNRVFYKGLCQFPTIKIYANAINDPTVPYLTAAIELEDPYLAYPANGAKPTLHEKYPYLLTDYTVPDVPPPLPPKPTPLSPNWFKSIKAPPMPPAFSVGFPLNVLLIISIPILVPAFVAFRVIRMTTDNRSSEKRIKTLEAHESHQNRLVHLVAQMEKNVEDAVVDLVETQGNSAVVASSSNSGQVDSKAIKKPTLTDAQKEIVGWLNTLPNLKKELAFIHTVSNSHPALVCRDLEKFIIHKDGQGILLHWADNFVF